MLSKYDICFAQIVFPDFESIFTNAVTNLGVSELTFGPFKTVVL